MAFWRILNYSQQTFWCWCWCDSLCQHWKPTERLMKKHPTANWIVLWNRKITSSKQVSEAVLRRISPCYIIKICVGLGLTWPRPACHHQSGACRGAKTKSIWLKEKWGKLHFFTASHDFIHPHFYFTIYVYITFFPHLSQKDLIWVVWFGLRSRLSENVALMDIIKKNRCTSSCNEPRYSYLVWRSEWDIKNIANIPCTRIQINKNFINNLISCIFVVICTK